MSSTGSSEIMIRPEPTPNPASIRFVVDATILESGTADFQDAASAEDKSPLVNALFALEGVTGVFLGPNFITITAPDVIEWDKLGELVIGVIRDHLSSGEPTLIGETNDSMEGRGEIEQGIIRIIEDEIRPAVAMDGGDIIFGGFEQGIVRLHLRGSCSGCPSSMMTLKMGIERRLQEEFPEVQSVEAIG
jgi:Fe-S cluster biogenesis protein NfuA